MADMQARHMVLMMWAGWAWAAATGPRSFWGMLAAMVVAIVIDLVRTAHDK